MRDIFVDADACPVRAEVYRVARRYGLQVAMVANQWIQVPLDRDIRWVEVGGKFDAADDWIASHIGEQDIAITADIPLAARCLKRGAHVVSPRGQIFSEDSIGDQLASRELRSEMLQMGIAVKPTPPLSQRDRSRFLSSLDQVIQRARRAPGAG